MKAPGSGPGPSSVSAGGSPAGSASVSPGGSDAESNVAWARPNLGLGLVAGFYLAAGLLSLAWPRVIPGRGAWPLWVQALADIVGLLVVLAAGAFVIARVAGPRVVRALGIHFAGIDLLLGLFVALITRAVVELITPSTGGLVPVFVETDVDRVSTVVVIAVGSALLAPLVEELFFRGAMQRLVHQLALPGLGRTAAGIVAVGVTTALFVLMHALPYGAAVPTAALLPPLLMGIGAGTLVAITGRLGGALVAHVLFNTVGVVLALV